MAKTNQNHDKQRTQYLLTFNNPADYGYTIEKIQSILQEQFRGLKYYCLSYEIAPSSGTPHVHLFFICNKVRWSVVQRRFPHAHIENEVKGTPHQVRAYIKKEAENLSDEKKASLNQFIEFGTLPTPPTFDKQNILEDAERMINEGKSLTEILDTSILFRNHESVIRKTFFAKRFSETPIVRDLKFYYHIGQSGTGKSHTYVQLCECFGEDFVYFTADYANKGTAAFDFYTGEPVVVLDELKPYSIPYGMLLVLTDKYRQPIHCRYANTYTLYGYIHITSIYPPEKLYSSMSDTDKDNDPITQLLRRITAVIYHYKDDKGNYQTFELPGSDYTSYEDLVSKAHAETQGFSPIETDEIPFL